MIRLLLLFLLPLLLLGCGGYPDGPGGQAVTRDYDCADFRTHCEAQRFFVTQGGPDDDPHTLDADQDGVACEPPRSLGSRPAPSPGRERVGPASVGPAASYRSPGPSGPRVRPCPPLEARARER